LLFLKKISTAILETKNAMNTKILDNLHQGHKHIELDHRLKYGIIDQEGYMPTAFFAFLVHITGTPQVNLDLALIVDE
jgi:hypothetical protein